MRNFSIVKIVFYMININKILFGITGVFVIGILCLVIYFSTAYPKIKRATHIKIESTSLSIKKGEYLVNNVAVCTECHSKRDWSLFSGPIIPKTIGMGGEKFDNKYANVPGTLFSTNITPFNLKNWTDGELYRVITTGVTRYGKVIFPMMPYLSYSNLDSDDVKSIICYLRSLVPIVNEVQESKLNFPENLTILTIPKDANQVKKPSETDTLLYGKYLVTIAACADCHTPKQNGIKIPGKDFSGGLDFSFPDFGSVKSSNITPDVETGIGSWPETMFIENFKMFSDSTMTHIIAERYRFQTSMPWTMFAGMKKNDLRAIYKYLMSIKRIKNSVIKFSHN